MKAAATVAGPSRECCGMSAEINATKLVDMSRSVRVRCLEPCKEEAPKAIAF